MSARSCPSCHSVGVPRAGCQNLWHIEVRTHPALEATIRRLLREELAPIHTELTRTRRALRAVGVHMEQEIADVEAAVQAEAAELAGLVSVVGKLVTDFETLEGQIGTVPSLSEEDRQALLATLATAQGTAASLHNLALTVTQADPAPAGDAPVDEPPAA